MRNNTNYKKKDQQVDIGNFMYGKVPPQAIDLEEAVLGAIMLEKDAIDIAAEMLKPESFYKTNHQLIYKAILRLNGKNQAIDILTVTDELRTVGELENAGGPYYVTRLTNSVVSSANIEKHCRIVKQKFLAREMIRLNGESIIEAYDEQNDVFELIDNHEKRLTELTAGATGKAVTAMDAALTESLKRMEALRLNEEIMTGVPSGLPDLDRLTNGWQNSNLIILAARPSVGKTAFALQLARSAALNHFNPVPVVFFSLEMSTAQLTNRIISAETEVRLEKINNGRLSDSDMRIIYEKGVSKLARAPLFIDDTSALTITELRAKCRRLAKQWQKVFGHKKGLIIIDYLQLMSGTGGKGNREQEISEISRGLKTLSKELDVPIIALSQLSRAVENRKGEARMPQLSDLRESGAIEQDADVVLFIYRPEYYDINANEMGESTKGETHVKIAKHRSGTLDTLKFVADLSIQKFYSWDSSFPTPLQASTQKAANTFIPTGNRYENDNDDAPF